MMREPEYGITSLALREIATTILIGLLVGIVVVWLLP